jgi:pyruvate formate lyase activating enzyme
MAVSGLLFNIQKFSIHDGPGIRTVVFFKGCPLSCRWCSNPESQDSQPCKEARWYTLEETLKICLADRLFYEQITSKTGAVPFDSPEYSGGGVTLSGGEALSQIPFALELLRAPKKEKIHTAIETSGFASPELFEKIAESADLLLFDIKHFDNKRHVEGTGVPNDVILVNLKNSLARNKALLPRIPVIPAYNNSDEDARGFASLLETMQIKRVQLLPFHQFGEKKYELLGLPYTMRSVPQLHPEDLEGYRQVFIGSGIDCFF